MEIFPISITHRHPQTAPRCSAFVAPAAKTLMDFIAWLMLAIVFTGAVPLPSHAAGDPAWPFDQPPLEVLRASPKKVFAHYFPPFPLSLDNKAPVDDYYTTQLLNPAGEQGKHQYCGGYLRERPLPRAPSADTAWRLRNLEEEVRRAVALGLDGFSVDIMDYKGSSWTTVNLLMQAAANVDPGFKIIIMPDMEVSAFRTLTSGGTVTPVQALTWVVTMLSKYPSAYRTDDGRLLVAPFDAHKQTAAWWSSWLNQMKDSGIDIAFMPTFQGWQSYANDFKSISVGYADWGEHTAKGQFFLQWLNNPTEAHQYVPIWMSTVVPQDIRPKGVNYREAINSLMYRRMWWNAIKGGADWVHIATWNDYSENTQISPSTGTQFSFYDLSAYFITWFKTGLPPSITRDVIYYFHRTHATSAAPDLSLQTGGRFYALSDGTGAVPTDYIEVLSFLTAPGTLQVDVDGVVTSNDVPAGPSVFYVPLREGTPRFTLVRDGAPVLDFQSAYPISNSIVYQNLHYRGGSSSRPPVPTIGTH